MVPSTVLIMLRGGDGLFRVLKVLFFWFFWRLVLSACVVAGAIVGDEGVEWLGASCTSCMF